MVVVAEQFQQVFVEAAESRLAVNFLATILADSAKELRFEVFSSTFLLLSDYFELDFDYSKLQLSVAIQS